MGDLPIYTWMFRLGGLIMLVILGAEIAGYSLFAQEVLDGSLKTIFYIWISIIKMNSMITSLKDIEKDMNYCASGSTP